ncbi:hypothetical protein NC652_007187 [Populus alba x Populus x berolinensis]|uniref:Uncharacterized protein n=3 Tax=Populus TaxID=3689 RepID=A0A4U5LSW5_POPAL|nr:hypothetical protein NC652_007187 [Populus alba x Populus x berolinensis]KAJ7008318.1 hypothetical protein NC653_007108 [Populus alba x Populus x berolinensis]TKR59118.1 hypothetical protein D5086_0000324650 [Populus alba]
MSSHTWAKGMERSGQEGSHVDDRRHREIWSSMHGLIKIRQHLADAVNGGGEWSSSRARDGITLSLLEELSVAIKGATARLLDGLVNESPASRRSCLLFFPTEMA